jgi:hypothetical protein
MRLADVSFDPGRRDWGSGILQRSSIVPVPVLIQESIVHAILQRGLGATFDTLSAHDLAWCRVIVELPHHKGSLGITPLPASGMAAFYSATAHMVSWLGSLPHASEWVAGQNLANPNTWNSSALQTLKQFFLQEQIKDHHHLHDNLVTSTSGHKAHHANVDAACAGAAKSAYGSHACRAHASSHPIGAHA